MNKKGNNNYIFIAFLLMTLTIISQLLRYKYIYLDINHILEISICNIIYPFTFLLTAIIYKKSNFNETHKIIIKTLYSILFFTFIVTLLNNIEATNETVAFDIALKHVFTPNNFIINGITFYYPKLFNILLFLLLFYFSHTILIIIIEALETYTNRFIAYFISMFIPFTLDMMCYTTLIDVFNKVSFNKLVIHLTSNFIVAIIFSILLSICYKKSKLYLNK